MSIDGVKVARGLELPVSLVGESVAILAKRNAGKTYTASVLAEGLIELGQQIVAVDPVGVWWGLRTNAKGDGPGLGVIVLGGEHADLPLNHLAGALIADLVVESWPQSFVIDTSLFDSNNQQDRFAQDFGERLYRRKVRDKRPMMLILEEADTVAPQNPMPDQRRLVGAYTTIARRGRSRGIGYCAVTQRPAALHKDLTTQAELLIVMQIIGSQDVDAIDRWTKSNASKEERAEVIASLAGLQQGEAWVWSPGWLRMRQRVKVRRRKTFDASRTPEPGEQQVEPTARAAVDLDAVRARIEEVAEEAKRNDPAEMRKRIAELERENRDLARQAAEAEPLTVEVERVVEHVVPTVPEGFSEKVETIARRAADLVGAANIVIEGAGACLEDVDGLREGLVSVREAAEKPTRMLGARVPPVPPRATGPAPVPVRAPQRPREAAETNGSLGKAERAILTVLIQHGERTTQQVAMLTGYSAKGGGFRNALGKLRNYDPPLVDRDEPMRATAGGAAVLGPVEPLPSGDALFDHWLRRFGKAERVILEALRQHGPMDVETLAALTDYAPGGGGFRNAIGKLRTLGLVDGGQRGVPLGLSGEFAEAIA